MQDYGLVDISLLSSYPHLQRLVLASNNLTGTDIAHPPIRYNHESKHFINKINGIPKLILNPELHVHVHVVQNHMCLFMIISAT